MLLSRGELKNGTVPFKFEIISLRAINYGTYLKLSVEAISTQK